MPFDPDPDNDATAAPLHEDGALDWEALRAGGRLHLFCYLRDTVLAVLVHEVCAAQ